MGFAPCLRIGFFTRLLYTTGVVCLIHHNDEKDGLRHGHVPPADSLTSNQLASRVPATASAIKPQLIVTDSLQFGGSESGLKLFPRFHRSRQ